MIKKNDEWAIVIVCIAFILGIMMALFHKPLRWYDEHTHYARSIQLSYGDFFVQGEPKNVNVGGYIDQGEIELINKAVFETEELGISFEWFSKFGDIKRTGIYEFMPVTNTITNHPIVYFPYIMVAFFASRLNISPLLELYLMRFAGLVCYMSIYLFAVRKSKKAKVPLILFLLCPVVFLSFGSVTADAYLISITTLFLVILFEKLDMISNEENFKEKDYIEIIVSIILMSFCKMPNFVLISLWLIAAGIANKTNPVKYTKLTRVTIISVIVAAIITLGFFFVVKDVNSGAYWGRNSDSKQQLELILHKPIKTIDVFIHEILNYTHYFSIQTGYCKKTYYYVPFWSGILLYIGIFKSAKDKKNNNCIDESVANKNRLFDLYSYLCVVAFVILVFFMLYLGFSEIGAVTIDGIQPRYFIPAMLLLLFVYAYHKPKVEENTFVSSCIMVSIPVLYYLASQI